MGEFGKLWSGFTIAQVGSQITVLALPLTAVLLLGAGATETGLLVAARMAPAFLALFVGVWVDRRRKRPVLIAADIGSAVVIASIPVAALLGVLTLTQLYVVAFLAGTFSVATDLSRVALVPALVGRAHLVRANSRLQGSQAVAQIAGPSLGGWLVQVLSAPLAMAFDAAGFLVSGALIAWMRVDEVIHPRSRRSVWHDVSEGLRHMRDQRVLFRCVVAITLANVEWFGVQAVLIVFATRDLGLPPALLGIVLATIGPFSLLGAAFVGPLTSRFGIGPVMIAALILEAASRLLLPFAGGTVIEATAVLMISQALVGITVPLWTVNSQSLMQAVTPDRLLGRVSSAMRLIAFGIAPPSAFVAGVLGDAIGLRPTLFAAGVIAVIAVVYLIPVWSFHSPAEAVGARSSVSV